MLLGIAATVLKGKTFGGCLGELDSFDSPLILQQIKEAAHLMCSARLFVLLLDIRMYLLTYQKSVLVCLIVYIIISVVRKYRNDNVFAFGAENIKI